MDFTESFDEEKNIIFNNKTYIVTGKERQSYRRCTRPSRYQFHRYRCSHRFHSGRPRCRRRRPRGRWRPRASPGRIGSRTSWQCARTSGVRFRRTNITTSPPIRMTGHNPRIRRDQVTRVGRVTGRAIHILARRSRPPPIAAATATTNPVDETRPIPRRKRRAISRLNLRRHLRGHYPYGSGRSACSGRNDQRTAIRLKRLLMQQRLIMNEI